MKRIVYTLWMLLLVMVACEKDTEPTWVAPQMTLEVVGQSSISRREATLKGNIGKNELDITECGFAYSKTKALLEKKVLTDNDVYKMPVEKEASTCEVSLTGLEPGTNYFYCLYITCGNTTIISPEILQFATTANDAPQLGEVKTPIEPDNERITVSCAVASVGAEYIDMRGFCYAEGADTDPDLRNNIVTVDEEMLDGDFAEFIYEIDGLSASTSYSIRAFAKNDAGSIGYGPVKVVTTAKGEKPTIRIDDEPEVRGSYALVTAEIASVGTSDITTKGFVWSSENASPTLDSGAHDGKIELSADENENKVFSHQIDNLKEGTTYFIRAYATNEKGVGYSSKVTIMTAKVEVAKVSIGNITNIQATSAETTATIDDNGGGTISRRGFCWSTSVQKPVIGNQSCEYFDVIAIGANFSTTLDSLIANQQQYWVVAYTENERGLVYSDVVSFRTAILDVPTLATPTVAIVSITTTGANIGSSVVSDNNSEILETGFCWSKDKNEPTIEDNTAKADASFMLDISGLKYGETYYVRAYAKNKIGIGYSQVVSFTTTQILAPTISAHSISNITSESAIVNTIIQSSNNGTIIEKGFCWSSTNAVPTVETDSKYSIEGNNTTLSHTLSGLAHSTTYYIRAYAINEAGVSYTDPTQFSTVSLNVPQLAYPVVNSETVNSAYVQSTIQNNGNSTIAEYGFCWSSKNNTPTEQDNEGIIAIKEGDFSTTMGGLIFGTTYYVRAYAKNSQGTGYSDTQVFSTVSIVAPWVETVVISNVSESGATLSAAITSTNNGTIKEKGFCWSTTPNVDNATKKIITGTNTAMTHTLSGLEDGTLYYVWAYAANEAGTGYSYINQFTTTKLSVPTTVVSAINSITVNSAYVSASVQETGNAAITERGFYWSSKTNTPNETNNEGAAVMASDAFNTTMTGLSYGTTYYVRAYAKNSVGIGMSEVTSFDTNTITIPSLSYYTDVTGVSVSNAYLSASIVSENNGKVTRKGFCWSTSQSTPTLGNADGYHDITSSVNTFSYTLSNLSPNTTYYVCAYAENQAGINYNQVAVFTTYAINKPSVDYVELISSTYTSAKVKARITDKGNLTITEAGFYWSETNAAPNGSASDGKAVFKNPTNDLLETEIKDLKQNTMYYVRAFATNSEGTTMSSVSTFTTPINPVPGDDDMINPGN